MSNTTTTLRIFEDTHNDGIEKLVSKLLKEYITTHVTSDNRDGTMDLYDIGYYVWDGDKSLGFLIHETFLKIGEVRDTDISYKNWKVTKFQGVWQDGRRNFSYSPVFDAGPGNYYPGIGCRWSRKRTLDNEEQIITAPIFEPVSL